MTALPDKQLQHQVNDVINDLCRVAKKLPATTTYETWRGDYSVYDSAMDTGCTDTKPGDEDPIGQLVWDMVAISYRLNALLD